MNNLQIKIFDQLTSHLPNSIGKHVGNSFCIENYPQSYFSMIRSGFSLYQNCFEILVQIKHFFTPEKGTTVSYGCDDSKYVFDGLEQVAILGMGSNDGFSDGDDLYQNQGYVIYQNTKCYFVSLFMGDTVMIRIPADIEIQREDWVTFISKEGNSKNAMCLKDLAGMTGRDPRELTSHLGRRIDRNLISDRYL